MNAVDRISGLEFHMLILYVEVFVMCRLLVRLDWRLIGRIPKVRHRRGSRGRFER
jgi:hypothetical protein